MTFERSFRDVQSIGSIAREMSRERPRDLFSSDGGALRLERMQRPGWLGRVCG